MISVSGLYENTKSKDGMTMASMKMTVTEVLLLVLPKELIPIYTFVNAHLLDLGKYFGLCFHLRPNLFCF